MNYIKQFLHDCQNPIFVVLENANNTASVASIRIGILVSAVPENLICYTCETRLKIPE